MKRIAYFDAFSGIAGDMTVGALLDAGAPAEGLLTALNELPTGARYEIEKTVRGGLAATKFRVHQEPHPARHRHLDHILKMIDGCTGEERHAAGQDWPVSRVGGCFVVVGARCGAPPPSGPASGSGPDDPRTASTTAA